jgi:transcriptional regulator with XRE-family HTH domain
MTGKQIRTIRKKLGLTQEKFAAAVGVTFQSVNRWENDQHEASEIAIKSIQNISAGKRAKTYQPKPLRHECVCGRVIWFLPSARKPR